MDSNQNKADDDRERPQQKSPSQMKGDPDESMRIMSDMKKGIFKRNIYSMYIWMSDEPFINNTIL